VDKAFSIVTAMVFVLCALGVGWFLSGGPNLGMDIDYGFSARPRSLEEGVALMGGALGTGGGIVVLAAIGLVTYGLQELCNYWFALVLVNALKKSGHGADAIALKIDRSPISRGLKNRLKKRLDRNAKFEMRNAK
jgi:hypothetical protein